MALLDERMTMTEDKTRRLDEKLDQVFAKQQASVPGAQAGGSRDVRAGDQGL